MRRSSALSATALAALAVLSGACRSGVPPGSADAPRPPAVAPAAEAAIDPPPVRRLPVPPEPAAKLAPELTRPWQGRRPVLVELAVQVDLGRLGRRIAGLSKDERRRTVIGALERVAAAEQGRLRPLLDRLAAAGEIGGRESYAVVNRLFVEATPAAVAALAERPEVAALAGRGTIETVELAAPDPPGPDRPAGGGAPTAWALERMGARAAHARGLDGAGSVVGIIDSGASARHRELAASFRGGPAAWLDAAGGRAQPYDGAYGHGTGVLGAAVGATVGVAPGARWVACAAFPDGRFDDLRLTRCADWILRRARPDVLINAWSVAANGCDRSVQPIVDAWRAAEILPVFAAGNTGPEPGANRSPANLDRLYPGDAPALAVGGHGADGRPYARSAAGPGACGGGTFPLLAAPAEGLAVPLPATADTYRLADGTSFAAGYVAGAAAVLLQAVPGATVAELEAALVQGAAATGAAAPDERLGHGTLDLEGSLAVLARTAAGRSGQRSATSSGPAPPSTAPASSSSRSTSRSNAR